VPDRHAYYLIGVLVCQADITTPYAFWADTAHEERHIWQQFVEMVQQYPEAPIYHYGSYEPRALATLAKRYQTDSEPLVARLVNVNRYIYGKVYFPVRSNGLKDIGYFIGARWTSPHASGLQSLVWRHQWEQTRNAIYRELLVTYNREDCQALKLLVDELANMQCCADTTSAVHYTNEHKRQVSEAGQEVQGQFQEILKFAHFGYNAKKISFRRTSDEGSKSDKVEIYKKRAEKRRQTLLDIRHRVRRIVNISADETCHKCGYKPLKQTSTISRRYIIDLVETRSGLKKTLKQYVGMHGYCRRCHRSYAPKQIRQYQKNTLYGHGLGAWVVYQRVALRLPYESIVELLLEQFHEKISIAQPIRFLAQYAEYYAGTEKSIIESLLRGLYIHADETEVNIKSHSWYVWVFTNEKYVIFKLTETREATIAHELLYKYPGVLVSDFYPGYDSVECRQQKCWVHLIRDLNDDLQSNPMDREYEAFVSEVRNLIVPIMETIQKYGLKSRYLNNFEKQVDSFYQRFIVGKQYKSDVVLTYQKRFLRYKNSLFTFLTEDDIPWHNNTAERAIRHFAIQRDISKRPFNDSATRDYLTLLSIRHTCRFQGKSFFKFLFSMETNLEKFEARKRKRYTL